MNGNDLYLTKAGYKKLREKLEFLQRVRRRELSKEIGEAIERGDISESAEYSAAKDAQALNEKKISELNGKLCRVKIIEDLDISADKVYIGAHVKLKDLKTSEELTRILVSSEEIDFEQGKISIYSPVGKGLLGHKEGDIVDIEVSEDTLKYEILKITRP